MLIARVTLYLTDENTSGDLFGAASTNIKLIIPIGIHAVKLKQHESLYPQGTGITRASDPEPLRKQKGPPCSSIGDQDITQTRQDY